MIISTTHTLQTQDIYEYIDIVSGEAIVGANMFKDIFAAIRDIVGGRSRAYEKTLRDAKDAAIREMIENAKTRRADAVVGVDIGYQVMGTKNGMLMVSAHGTAVKLK